MRLAPFLEDTDFRLYVGDALDVLRELGDESVHCCVTSPPYWGLRDYGVEGQLGNEATPGEYVSRLVSILAEVKRVLRADGTLWLNLGDTFVKKSLVGIPWRVAFALVDDGWFLRADVIWSKPNTMPEAVTDRPTIAHEYLFLLARSARYYYDVDAIREPFEARPQQRLTALRDQPLATARRAAGVEQGDPQGGTHANPHQRQEETLPGLPPEAPRGPDGRRKTIHDHSLEGSHDNYKGINGRERWPHFGRNKRTVWEIPTTPNPEAHFAVFPEALVRPCILAGSPERGVVLDPFLGSGTTTYVARRHQRRSIGIELSPEYALITSRRMAQQSLFAMSTDEGR